MKECKDCYTMNTVTENGESCLHCDDNYSNWDSMRRVMVSFKWYDIWIGGFVDIPHNTLYICPIPMIVIRIRGKRP